MHKRALSQGETQLLIEALQEAASNQQLRQVNSDLLVLRSSDENNASEEVLKRLTATAAEADLKRQNLELFCLLLLRGAIVVESHLVIPELA